MGDSWDLRHAARAGEPLPACDAFVVEVLERLGPGAGRRAADLACGSGRHALLLAQQGWQVAAWDASEVALGDLRGRAAEAGLSVATRAVDLEGGVDLAPTESLELALIVNFLDRGLLAGLARLVVPGGHVVFTTFTVDREGSRPRAARCLRRGELAHGIPGFETLVVREEGGRAGILARRGGPA